MAKGRRGSTEINASSMADIAFLLLIFFLVTTTIDQDKGILHGLPPWTDEEQDDVKLKDKDVLEILVNSANQLLVEGEYMDVSKLRERTKDHIMNKNRRPDYPDSPDKAIISLKNDRGTSYDIYIQIQNELKAAYSELRNDKTIKVTKGTFKTYVELKECASPINEDKRIEKCKAWKKEVKTAIPMKISEAEPANIGG